MRCVNKYSDIGAPESWGKDIYEELVEFCEDRYDKAKHGDYQKYMAKCKTLIEIYDPEDIFEGSLIDDCMNEE